MFNVYPVEIRYIRTAQDGVLAGIPCRCTFGVESVSAGRKAYEDLVIANPSITFSDLEIITK